MGKAPGLNRGAMGKFRNSLAGAGGFARAIPGLTPEPSSQPAMQPPAMPMQQPMAPQPMQPPPDQQLWRLYADQQQPQSGLARALFNLPMGGN
jgi:hypothetical protein